MRTIYLLLAGLFVAFALTGCVERYVEPTGPAVASVYLVSDLNNGGPPGTHMTKAGVYKDNAQCTGYQNIGEIADAGQSTPLTVKVVSGQPVTITLTGISTSVHGVTSACNAPVTFLPMVGGQYEARFVDQYPVSCMAIVKRRDSTGQYIPDPTTVHRVYQESLTGSTCQPLAIQDKIRLGIQ
ncbi:MAG TPA: hypothetical protein VGH91_11020 [Gammaproteobacteria bacterium]|jgi:hypothetical protein